MQTTRWSRWCAAAALTLALGVDAATPQGPTTAPPTSAAVAPPSATSTPTTPPPTTVAPVPGAPSAAAASAPLSGAPMTRSAYRAALDRAASEYNRQRAACRPMKGNDRTVCIAEAKAESRRAESAAEAAFRNTSRARMDARVIAANADYAVAKARCNAKTGTERRNCLKVAKEKQSAVITAAMRAPF